jgi:DNA-binding beta-propeller fold protein YncE
MMRKAILAPMLALIILLLTSPLLLTTIGDGTGLDSYAVLEDHSFILSVVNSGGERAVIYQFATRREADLQAIEMDSSGNYIVTQGFTNTLSKITPAGVMTVIYNFSTGTWPSGFAIDSSGDYIVCEYFANILSKITPTGERTVIYAFPKGSGPGAVAIDPSGNYIVLESDASIISKVTPTGQRTVIYTYDWSSYAVAVAIDSSENYIVCEVTTNALSKVTPNGVRTSIYNFTTLHTWPVGVAIDSSGNYIVAEAVTHVLSRITPTGERTVIYKWPSEPYTEPWGVCMYVSAVPQLLFTDIAENGLKATWTQSTDPFFTEYQLYQSSTQGELGALIGTDTNIADTSLTVSGLSPGTTYYFTLRILGANGLYIDSGPRGIMTAKAFWQQDWFPYAIFWVVLTLVVVIVLYVLYIKYKKRAQVT